VDPGQRARPARAAGLGARRLARVALAGGLVAGLLAVLACGSEPAAPEAPAEDTPTATPGSAGDADGAARETPRRALWVLAEGARRVLDHPARIPDLVATAGDLAATDLFVQVYRGGRAWYDSDRADSTPWQSVRDAQGLDPLALLLERAHAADLRVHAWVNVLSLTRNRDAPILERLGRDVVLVDRRGRSLLDYPDFEVPQPDRRWYRMGTPGLYLDPAAPGLADELAATYAELLARYPTLDGLHLDYIRYPDVLPFVPGTRFGVGLDFGYGEATRERFRAETGKRAPFRDSLANANAWDAWRREKLTGLVASIAGAAREVKPDVRLSAAVWSYADRAYLVLGQDWRRWLEDDLLDFAVPMAYTLDDRLLRYHAEHYAGRPQGERIWVGLGTWLFADAPERALEQIRLARAAGAPAVALFSYDSIVTAPALHEALVAEAGRAP